jgi:hypothetical protein
MILCNLVLHSELPLKRKSSCEGVTLDEVFFSPLRVPPERIEVRPSRQLIGRVKLPESAVRRWLDDVRGLPGSKGGLGSSP